MSPVRFFSVKVKLTLTYVFNLDSKPEISQLQLNVFISYNKSMKVFTTYTKEVKEEIEEDIQRPIKQPYLAPYGASWYYLVSTFFLFADVWYSHRL